MGVRVFYLYGSDVSLVVFIHERNLDRCAADAVPAAALMTVHCFKAIP